MSRPGRSTILVGALVSWIGGAVGCGPGGRDQVEGAARAADAAPEADVVIARFEDASGRPEGGAIVAALRLELAERLAWARGVAFTTPMEPGGWTPEVGPETDAIVRGRWTGSALELVVETPSGALVTRARVAPERLADGAARIAGALGLTLDARGAALPVPDRRADLGAALVVIERAREAGGPLTPGGADVAAEDAWGLWARGTAAVFADDPAGGRALLDRALALAPDLLGARYTRTHATISERERLDDLRALVAASPRLRLFVGAWREAAIAAMRSRLDVADAVGIAASGLTTVGIAGSIDEHQALTDAVAMWALVEGAPIAPVERADLLLEVAASALVTGDPTEADRRVAELRARGVRPRRAGAVAALATRIRLALGRQSQVDAAVGFIEARDYGSPDAMPVGARDCSGATPLGVAAERGEAQVVIDLLARGADPLAANLRGQTALHRAAWLGHDGVVQALVARGVEMMDDQGRTALALAIEGDHPEVVARLLAGGARTDARDRRGATPILVAATLGRDRVVPLLARAGADLAAEGDDGRSALELVIERGHVATLDALIAAGVPIERAHLELAARSGRPAVLDRLLASGRGSAGAGMGTGTGTSDLDSVLRAALAVDDVAMVAHLEQRGVQPAGGRSLLEAAVEEGARNVLSARLTPAARAARGVHGLRLVELALVQTEPAWQVVELLAGNDDVAALAWLGDVERLTAALDRDPAAAGRLGADGLGALHHAVRGAQTDAVTLLIDRGAAPGLHAAASTPYAPEIAGWTPLHFAFAVARPDLVLLLLAKGARLDAKDARGRMAGQLVHLPWLEQKRFDRVAEAKVFLESKEGVALLAELEQDDVISAPRPALVLGDAYIPDPVTGGRLGVRYALDGEGFGFGGRGIQLPIRIADTSVLRRAAVDMQDDVDRPSAGLEHMLLRCYDHAAWPEARRVARDLVRARDDEGASDMVKGLAHHNLAVVELRNGDLAAAAPGFEVAAAAFAEATVTPHVALQASILENRSELAWRSERWQDAIDDLKRALALRERYDQEPRFVPIPWLLMGMVYGEWGRYKDSIETTTKGLGFAEVSWGKDHPVTLIARGNLAVLLDALGDRARATKLAVDQVAALEARGDAADPQQLAVARANAALFLWRGGDARRAVELVSAAMHELAARDPDNFLLGRIMLIGGDILVDADPATAEAAYRGAIERLAAAYGERTGVVAGAMRRLAMMLGPRDPEAGMTLLMESWVIASQADAPEERWPIEIELARVAAAQGRMPTAIFFGKQAVGTLERIRADARGVGVALERSLVESRIAVWHLLADWLVAEGRLEEATRVLALLKDDEERSLITRGGRDQAAATGQAVPRTPTEARMKAAADAQAEELARAGGELEELAALKRTKGLDAQGERRLDKARDTVREARRRFDQYLREVEVELRRMDADRAAEVGAMNLREVGALQGTLAELGHGAVLVHYLVIDERLRIMVTTPTVQIGRTADVSARDLNALVFRFRQALADPRSDPRPIGQELHALLIAPIEQDLRQAKAETLMVALDGTLRYIPLAALWDGERWLVERYRVVSFARAGLDKLTAKPTPGARVAGLGVGKKIEGHSQLKEVPRELEGIVRRDAADPDGVLPGAVWMDEAFGHDTLGELIETKAYSAIHIASHFVFEPGTEADSYLLLGDGGRLTLEDIRYDLRFDGVELLSLSACNTAVGGEGGQGREIEGFAALTLRQGVRAVLATLWPVADRSTGELMRSLYAIVGSGAGGVTKADALRHAQLKFIRGKDALDPADLVPRGPRPLVAPGPPTPGPTPTPPAAPPVDRSHPYYWAPFVLIGNWL